MHFFSKTLYALLTLLKRRIMLELEKKVVKGTAWANFALFIEHGVTFFFTILLARILFPQDFGLIALANIVLLLAIMLKTLGINQALVQREKDIEKAADITFIMQLIVSFVLSVLIFFASPWIGLFFGNDILGQIVKVLSFAIIIEAFGATHATLLEKELDFKKKFWPISLGTLTYNLTAVLLAVAGFGVWSLVVGQVAKTLVSAVLFWFVCPWRPSFRFDAGIAKEMIGYGRYALGRDFVGFLSRRIDSLSVGKFLGSVSLGFYSEAYNISQAFSERLSLTTAMFPAFSKLQSQKKALLDMFFKTTKYASAVLMPVLVGLFAIVPNFVIVLFGQKWAPMIPLLRVLLICSILSVPTVMTGDLLRAIGKVRLLFNLQIVCLVMLVFALFFALPYGVLGVCIAITIVSVVTSIIRMVFFAKILNVRIIDYLKIFPKIFLGSAIMLVCTLVVQDVILPLAGLGNSVNLVFSVLTGAIEYFLMLFFLDRNLFISMKSIVRFFY